MQDNRADGEAGRHGQARRLAEAALRAQAEGRDEEADRLFAEAGKLDPQAVAAILDAGVAPAGDVGSDAVLGDRPKPN